MKALDGGDAMKLRKPCKHDMYDGHVPTDYREPKWCDGGVFLPDDTLIIEKENGEWPEWAKEILSGDFLAREAE